MKAIYSNVTKEVFIYGCTFAFHSPNSHIYKQRLELTHRLIVISCTQFPSCLFSPD